MPAAKPGYCRLNRGHPLGQGVMAAWPLHEGTGPTTDNVSGINYYATLTNMSASPSSTSGWWRKEFGYAIMTDGVDDCLVLNIGTSTFFDFPTGTYTVGLLYSCASGAGSVYLIAKRRTASGWFIRVEAAGTIVIRTLGNANVAAQRTSVSTTARDGLPHTIVGIFKIDTVTQGNNDAHIYFDGKLDEGALTNLDVYVADAGSVTIGADSQPANFATAAFSHVIMWNRGLSANEAELFHQNPFSMYQFESPLKRFWFPPPAAVASGKPRRLLSGVGL
jgi:Concanavalin A-like lectin/glucanases superfamily